MSILRERIAHGAEYHSAAKGCRRCHRLRERVLRQLRLADTHRGGADSSTAPMIVRAERYAPFFLSRLGFRSGASPIAFLRSSSLNPSPAAGAHMRLLLMTSRVDLNAPTLAS